MPDSNVMVTSMIGGMLNGANLVISNIPWWLWVMVILLGVLRITTKKRSRRRSR